MGEVAFHIECEDSRESFLLGQISRRAENLDGVELELESNFGSDVKSIA